MKRQDAVGAVVVAEDGRILLIQRGRPPGRGSWTLPGGKVEPGESLAAAIAREVLEETGIRVRAVELLTVVLLDGEGFSYAIHEHVCRLEKSGAAPRPGDDAAQARWVSPSDLEALGVSPEARSVISLALTRLKREA